MQRNQTWLRLITIETWRRGNMTLKPAEASWRHGTLRTERPSQIWAPCRMKYFVLNNGVDVIPKTEWRSLRSFTKRWKNLRSWPQRFERNRRLTPLNTNVLTTASHWKDGGFIYACRNAQDATVNVNSSTALVVLLCICESELILQEGQQAP